MEHIRRSRHHSTLASLARDSHQHMSHDLLSRAIVHAVTSADMMHSKYEKEMGKGTGRNLILAKAYLMYEKRELAMALSYARLTGQSEELPNQKGLELRYREVDDVIRKFRTIWNSELRYGKKE